MTRKIPLLRLPELRRDRTCRGIATACYCKSGTDGAMEKGYLRCLRRKTVKPRRELQGSGNWNLLNNEQKFQFRIILMLS